MRRWSAIALAVLAIARPSASQTGWVDRARIGVSGGVQFATAIADQDGDLVLNAEDGRVTATATGPVPFLSGDVAFRLTPRLGVTVAFSYATGSGDTEVTADVPHPFYLDQPRTVTGVAADVKHQETVVHAGLVYMLRPSPRMDVALSGGASFFRVDQDVVDDVFFRDEYPYDSAVFEGVSLSSATASAVGFHAAVDLTWRASPRWGIGILTRYSRAGVPFEVAGEDAGTAQAGGLQVGAGIRWMIPARPRRPAPPTRPGRP
jgi:hypothetical protein